mgnify:CR=1 FL=1
MTITIRPATDADLDETLALLAAAGLPTADVTIKELALAAESGGELLGVIGLESFSDAALLRSLVVSEAARGSGVGKALVSHLLAEARARSYSRLSLETGTMAGFAPARRLYQGLGFSICPPFGSYFVDPNSVCMTMTL